MSEEERIEGARLIEEKIREEFSKAGKNVDSIDWNLERGGKLLNYSSHTIYISSEGKELKLNSVPDERLLDYPGGVGNENLNAHIRQLCSQ